MAEVKTYPFVRHLRSEPTAEVLRYRKGSLRGEGPGLTFWFSPNSTAVVEVPLEDQDLPFLFHARSADFQDLAVQGVITYRFSDPALIARRVDFSVDLRSGQWSQTPLEQVNGLLVQMAQQYVIDELMGLKLRAILAAGVAPIRERITDGLSNEPTLKDLGIEITAVRVAGVAAETEVQRALQQPTLEAIQQQADEATFSRRALAVEKERAIAENELAKKIELARREENLVGQEGANQRRHAQEQAAADAIAAEATDQRERIANARRADAVRSLETAKLEAERARAQINSELGAQILVALAARELAGELGKVEHLTITPELLTPLLGKLSTGASAAPKE